MEKFTQKLTSSLDGTKIKLRIEQDRIMCSGRKRVSCHYRGKVISCYSDDEGREHLSVEIKSFGNPVQVLFINQTCVTFGWSDLQIVK